MRRARELYALYDRSSLDDDRLADVAAVLVGGAIWLQYRDKRAAAPDRRLLGALAQLTRTRGARLIVNDDWRTAASIGADGVHIGQRDGDLRSARAALGPDALIGISCQDRIERARAGLASGANYVSFGRFFASATKPDARPADPAVLAQARSLAAPVVAIGGINRDNAAAIIAAGADLIAVSGALFGADRRGSAAAELAALFDVE